MSAVDTRVSDQWTMLEIFEECQQTTMSHPRLCSRLKSLYEKSRFNYFCDEFFELCRYSLVNMERTPPRERTIDFIIKFIFFCGKSDGDDTENVDTLSNRLLLKMFLFCIKYNECPNAAVRFRCTQIIHKLLECIGENGVIPDELFTDLRAALLRRVQDVKVAVRVQAIQALSRMQDPAASDCPAVESFIWLARHDQSTEVRRSSLCAMVLTTKTLPVFVERCRDLSDIVRRTAYKLLAARSVLRCLSIAKRIRLLQNGLSDRSSDVRQATQGLVLAWFKACEDNPIQLLRRLDTEGVPATSQLVLDNLFTILPVQEFNTMVHTWTAIFLTEDRTLKSEALSPDSAFFWRCLVEFLIKRTANAEKPVDNQQIHDHSTVQPPPNGNGNDGENEADSEILSVDFVIPSVSAYVEMARSVVDHLVKMVLAGEYDEKAMEQECIVEHVLRLALSLDLTDEFGRRKLMGLVHDWITSPSVPSNLSPHLLKVHAIMEPNLRHRINSVIEMISELCDPVEPQQEQATNNSASEASKNGPSTDSASTGKNDKDPAAPKQPVALSKVEERAIRLQIAKLEVKLNELKESLHTCVRSMEFERATEIRDECNRLDNERSTLLHKLHGENILAASVENQKNETEQPSSSDKTGDNELSNTICEGATDAQKSDDEGAEGEDAQQNILQRCSPNVLSKANRLAALVIQQSPTLWRLPASLRSLLDSLILPSIRNEDPSVRNQAILTLGLCCSMDLPLALQYVPLFYSAMRVDHVMISETALRCLIDCLLIFGFRPFHEAKIKLTTASSGEKTVVEGYNVEMDEEEEDEDSEASDYVVLMRRNEPDQPAIRQAMSKTAARLLKPIVALLDSEDDDLRTASALGMAKLLLYDRFISSHVISKLILLWFSPISEDRPIIRRGLACFFTDYVCGNTASAKGSGMGNSRHQAALTDAILPTLNTLIRAPASSPLSEIEAADVAALLAHLTDLSLLDANKDKQPDNQDEHDANEEGGNEDNAHYTATTTRDNPHHDRLALQLSNEMLKAPQSAEAKLYLRMLCHLRVSHANLAVHKEMLMLGDAMTKFSDRSTTLVLHRFRKQVNQNLERLGLNPEQVLKECKRAAQDQPDSPSTPNQTKRGNLSTNGTDLDLTMIATDRKSMFAPNNQPTILGSVRANVHGASMLHPSNVNRTLGVSVLDKSGRHANLLHFSESEESDVEPAASPARNNQSRSSKILKEPIVDLYTEQSVPNSGFESSIVTASLPPMNGDDDEADKENAVQESNPLEPEFVQPLPTPKMTRNKKSASTDPPKRASTRIVRRSLLADTPPATTTRLRRNTPRR